MIKNNYYLFSMIRFSKLTLLLITFLMVLVSSSANGQTGSDIKERFISYCRDVPREEIYLQTDREEFIAGEDLWFNIFLIDRQSNKLSDKSEIVYFELLNPDNMPVIRRRFRIENGSGPGQIILPDSLSSGKYTVRAYTNWMKNFLPANCFIQKINIYNALSSKNFIEKPDISSSITGKDNKDLNSTLANSGISVIAGNSESSEIILKSTSDFRSASNSLCYVFIQTRGTLNYINTIRLQNDNAKLDILINTLPPGINQIVVFDFRGRLVAEKYLFTPEKSELPLKLNAPEDSKTRSLVKATVESGNGVISSKLSISVTPESEYHYVQNLTDYMVFGTEFGTLPEEFKTNSLNNLSQNVIDNFLATAKSNWIDWSEIAKGEIPSIKYKMEKGEHFIYGKLVNSSNAEPQPDEYIFMSTPGKTAVFQYARTDSSGNFNFRIPISGTAKDLIIQPEMVDKNNTIKIESSFSEEYNLTENRSDTLKRVIPGYISKWSVNYQVSKIFEISYFGEPYPEPGVITHPVRFYGKPDIELIMDDYIKLPVMEEVFFELLPGVFLKKKKSGYEMSVLDPVDKRVYNNPPLLMVDGVVVNDASVIAAIDPEKVERIDAVKEKYFVGDYLFYGLVNVITREAKFNAVTLPDYAIRMQYRVIEPLNTFKSPDYNMQEKNGARIPDFRNTVYWNPSIVTGEGGKSGFQFWTSDFKSDYVVNIQGVSADGKLISFKRVLKVK
jgi:hypothetical protein